MKKIAIIHYWFVTWRGGEKVVENLLKLYPEADIYTHVISPEIRARLDKYNIFETFIGRLPFARRIYQKYLPLMPLALEQLDLSGYDLIISSESGPAKNVIVDPDAIHICYCHSPMRYAWDMYHLYQRGASWLTRLLMVPIMHYMRFIDASSAARVDYFIANSDFIARRIEKCYRRVSTVIYPPVEVEDFRCQVEKKDYYLMLGQVTAYKKADLVIDAFRNSDRKLVVIGEGEQLAELKAKASDNINILGRQPFDVVKKYLADAKALVFPGVEDFGIVPLEAMASGTPVIAFGKGGALETVIDSDDPGRATGILFHEQSVLSLNVALDRFESLSSPILATTCRKHAEKFSSLRFRQEIDDFVRERWAQKIDSRKKKFS